MSIAKVASKSCLENQQMNNECQPQIYGKIADEKWNHINKFDIIFWKLKVIS